MKVKTKSITFEKLQEIKTKKDRKPIKPNIFWRALINLISIPDLLIT